MADHESVIVKVGILTVSDSCFSGSATDRSGENLKQLVESGKFIRGSVVTKDIIPDETDQIKAKLLHWSDHLKLDLILTTGGTGFAPRDVTPEATKAVIEKEALGMTVAMLKGSLEITPLAMLTRLTCGTRGRTLIINLPGSTKGSAECFQIAATGIPHAVDLLRGHRTGVEKTHTALQAEGIRSAHSTHHQSSSQFSSNMMPSMELSTELHALTTAMQIAQSSMSGSSRKTTENLGLNYSLSAPSSSIHGDNSGLLNATVMKNGSSSLVLEPNNITVATLQFWKSLLSLSDEARLSLVNSLPSIFSTPRPIPSLPDRNSLQSALNPPQLNRDKFSSTGGLGESQVQHPLLSVTQFQGLTTVPSNIQVVRPQMAQSAKKLSSTSQRSQTSDPLSLPSTSSGHPLTTGTSAHLSSVPIYRTQTVPSTATPSLVSLSMPTLSLNQVSSLQCQPSSALLLNSERDLSTRASNEIGIFHGHVPQGMSQNEPPIQFVHENNEPIIFNAEGLRDQSSLQYLPLPSENNPFRKILKSPNVETSCKVENNLPLVLTASESAPDARGRSNLLEKLDPQFFGVASKTGLVASAPKLPKISSTDVISTREIKPMTQSSASPVVQVFLPSSSRSSSSQANDFPIDYGSHMNYGQINIMEMLRHFDDDGNLDRHSEEPDKSGKKGYFLNSSAMSDSGHVEISTECSDRSRFEHDTGSSVSHVEADKSYKYSDVNEYPNSRESEVSDVEMISDGDFDIFCTPEDNHDVTCAERIIKSEHSDFNAAVHNEVHHQTIEDEFVIVNKQEEMMHIDFIDKNISACVAKKSTSGLLMGRSVFTGWSRSPEATVTIKSAKIHSLKAKGELLFVPVGTSLKSFINEHPLVQGICLHKGKREIKKQLAQLCRQYDVGDRMTTWRRGKEILERNRFDDYFELTDEGKREQEEVAAARKRDQYVVNWYVWCPGHSNCKRKCGGFGICLEKCKGMMHKQDRHNCSLMINMKLFLSDLSTWRVNITGTHIPPGSGVTWVPPALYCLQSPSCKSKDHISPVKSSKPSPKKSSSKKPPLSAEANLPQGEISAPEMSMSTFSTGVCHQLKSSSAIPSKKRISKMLSSLKRRREERQSTQKSHSQSQKSHGFESMSVKASDMKAHGEDIGDIQLNARDKINSWVVTRCSSSQEAGADETSELASLCYSMANNCNNGKCLSKTDQFSQSLMCLLESTPSHNSSLPGFVLRGDTSCMNNLYDHLESHQNVFDELGASSSLAIDPQPSSSLLESLPVQCPGPCTTEATSQSASAEREEDMSSETPFKNSKVIFSKQSADDSSAGTCDSIDLDQPFLNANTLTEILQQANVARQTFEEMTSFQDKTSTTGSVSQSQCSHRFLASSLKTSGLTMKTEALNVHDENHSSQEKEDDTPSVVPLSQTPDTKANASFFEETSPNLHNYTSSDSAAIASIVRSLCGSSDFDTMRAIALHDNTMNPSLTASAESLTPGTHFMECAQNDVYDNPNLHSPLMSAQEGVESPYHTDLGGQCKLNTESLPSYEEATAALAQHLQLIHQMDMKSQDND